MAADYRRFHRTAGACGTEALLISTCARVILRRAQPTQTEQGMQLKNSVFLITGGASGLGAATARVAIDNGAKVIIADLQAELGQKLAESFGANARYLKTDVTSEADAKAAVELAVT